jgi:hypothetical protein
MCFVFVQAQDVIILKTGDEIEAIVTEVLKDDINYKKASNPAGPTITLAKSKIFMIRYQSGDKDVFNKEEKPNRSYTNTSGNKAVKTITLSGNPSEFVFDPDIGDQYCRIKKQRGVKLYGTRGNEVYFRSDIVFYGFDITYLKLTNPAKIGDGIAIVSRHAEEWNEILTQEMLTVRKISDWMRKPTLFPGNSVFPNYRYMDTEYFVTSVNYCLRLEDIEKIVKSYVLGEKSGIGMVVNLANFNKEREYSLIWVTFFDIDTREILFAVECSGKAGGPGMGKHWAEGVSNAFREMFIDEVFKPQRNQNHQINSKLLFY